MKKKEDEDFCGRCHSGAEGGCWFEYPVQGTGAHITAAIVCGGGNRFVSGNVTAYGCSSILPLAAELAGSACPLPALGWNNTALAPTSANVPEVIKHNLHSKEQYPMLSDLDARKT